MTRPLPAPAAAVAAALTAAGSARALAPLPERRPAAWSTMNHRGRSVSLVAGPAAAAGVALPLAVAALLRAGDPRPGLPARVPAAAAGLALTAAVVGRYDDTAGARPEQRAAKGFRGHAAALRSGRLTAGAVKVAGIGGAALAACAGAGLRGGRLVTGPLLVAGSANLANLFDFRPGRALKAVAVPAVALALAPATRGTPARLLAATTAGAAAALLPADLQERRMLGDAGANALGAVLGLGAALVPAPGVRGAALVAVLGLTAASEVVSFSRVIEATPPLAWADRLGRLPA